MLGLRWEDVDLLAGTVTVQRRVSHTTAERLTIREGTKMSRGQRTLPLPDLVRGAFGEEAGSGFIVSGKSGEPLNPWDVNRKLNRLLTRAGLGHTTVHQLRHDYAGLLLQDGVPLPIVSALLGHRDPSITARVYSHVAPEIQRVAAARIDAVLGHSSVDR